MPRVKGKVLNNGCSITLKLPRPTENSVKRCPKRLEPACIDILTPDSLVYKRPNLEIADTNVLSPNIIRSFICDWSVTTLNIGSSIASNAS